MHGVKVLHVITGLAAGGAETQLRLLVRHISADADVVALYNPGVLADFISTNVKSVLTSGIVTMPKGEKAAGPILPGKAYEFTVSASLLKTVEKHGTYVNVHTAKNPNGEVRGQVKVSG